MSCERGPARRPIICHGDENQLTDPGTRLNKEKHEGEAEAAEGSCNCKTSSEAARQKDTTSKGKTKEDALPESEEERLGVPLPMGGRGGRAGHGGTSTGSGGTSFAEAFADVGKLTVAMEECMDAIERDVHWRGSDRNDEDEERTSIRGEEG